tara:strand:+ start:94 stop:501 length:408 start_codon:yes stop_codon:yes gene_type:complete
MNWYKLAQPSTFSCVGTLRYAGENWAVLDIDQGICNFYRAMIPKSQFVRPQMYKAHITVVRLGREKISNIEAWGKYEGEQVPFTYSNEIKKCNPYYCLDAWSPRLEEIRVELGLPPIRGGYDSFHITLGNFKDLQ